MKNEVAARAVAMAELARSGFRPRGDLWLLAVADEEDGTADVGMRWLLEARPDIRPDLAINEGGGERLPLADGRVVLTVEHRREGHLPRPGGRGRRGGARVDAGRGRQRRPPAGRAAAPGRSRDAAAHPSPLVDRTLEVLLGEPVADFAAALSRAAGLHPVLARHAAGARGDDDGADPADRLDQAQRDARPGLGRAGLPDPAGHHRGRRRARGPGPARLRHRLRAGVAGGAGRRQRLGPGLGADGRDVRVLAASGDEAVAAADAVHRLHRLGLPPRGGRQPRRTASARSGPPPPRSSPPASTTPTSACTSTTCCSRWSSTSPWRETSSDPAEAARHGRAARRGGSGKNIEVRAAYSG